VVGKVSKRTMNNSVLKCSQAKESSSKREGRTSEKEGYGWQRKGGEENTASHLLTEEGRTSSQERRKGRRKTQEKGVLKRERNKLVKKRCWQMRGRRARAISSTERAAPKTSKEENAERKALWRGLKATKVGRRKSRLSAFYQTGDYCAKRGRGEGGSSRLSTGGIQT